MSQESPHPQRPNIVERRAYQANLPVEEFMVPILESAIRRTLEGLAEQPGLRVLDAGCGGQPFRSLLEANGNTYVSCDASDPLGLVDHIAELDRDLPETLIRDGPFDFVLCSEVLEHVLDWDRAFENLVGLLAPSGRLLVTSPFIYVLHEQPYDFWRATPHAIRTLAERHDMRVLRLESLGGTWDVIGTVLGATLTSVQARNSSLGARVLTRVTRQVMRRVFKALANGTLQQSVQVGDEGLPVYLANVALLEKLAGR